MGLSKQTPNDSAEGTASGYDGGRHRSNSGACARLKGSRDGGRRRRVRGWRAGATEAGNAAAAAHARRKGAPSGKCEPMDGGPGRIREGDKIGAHLMRMKGVHAGTRRPVFFFNVTGDGFPPEFYFKI
jgi:hypothetical protein